jgi:hypothetical protein
MVAEVARGQNPRGKLRAAAEVKKRKRPGDRGGVAVEPLAERRPYVRRLKRNHAGFLCPGPLRQALAMACPDRTSEIEKWPEGARRLKKGPRGSTRGYEIPSPELRWAGCGRAL